jgi:tRNA pseudouridine13 synthase
VADPTEVLPHALGGPVGTAAIKRIPDDFIVEEQLGFTPSGEGEHVFLRIEKRGENTDYLARQLARLAAVPLRNVGYAGLKDRHGSTIQWFSVQLPGQVGPDWSVLTSDAVRVLDVTRNNRKLKKGAASGNYFEIRLRELDAARLELETRLATISERGVPNYFGPQRFGRNGGNLDRARELFANSGLRIDHHRRGMYLSAARSEIFNHILAERVRQGNWDKAMSGDVFMFPDSQSFFKPDTITDEIVERVKARRIDPSGVLWGTAASTASDHALAIEQHVAARYPDLCAGLEGVGMETARRPFRLSPEGLSWDFPEDDVLRVSFTLPAGAFATVVLRELVHMNDSEI